MNRQTYYDQLTDLPNRYLLMDRLNQALFVARRHQVQDAVFYIVVDRWQQLLDDYGQTEIDQLIKQIGQKFTAVLREEDTVASLGGNEFGILISNIGSETVSTTTEIRYVLDKLTNVFEQVFVVAEQSLLLSMSIGIAMVPDDGEDASAILENAGKSAKNLCEQGGDGFIFYAEKLQKQSDSRTTTFRQLQKALETDQLQLYYQAVVNDDKQIFGVETLLYWQHPELGLVGPEQFIPMAEECGLIKQIGAWVLNNACQQFIEFSQSDSGGQLSYLAINISTQQFYAPGFYNIVEQAIQQANMEPEQLVLELTEGLMQQDIERASETLLQLNALGVLIAIDDFGTGYSSLVSLEQYPLRQLKIDQSFVDDINETDAQRIIKTIISVARNLEIEVIAKGVETKAQYRQLQKLECNKYQGFLFNKPMAAADFSQFLAQEEQDFAVL